MKKILLMLAASAAISFSACSGKAPTETADAEAAEVEQTEAQASDEAQPATDADDAVIELGADDTVSPTDKPVIVDFNATWCGPCKAFAPTYHEVAAEYAAKATFASADVDVCEALARDNQISSIPCVIIFYPAAESRKPARHEGLMTKDEFKEFLDKNL